MQQFNHLPKKIVRDPVFRNAKHSAEQTLVLAETSLYHSCPYAAVSCEVQWGQRLAWMGMVVKQKGHSLVLGSAAGASFSRFMWLMPLITRNTAKAMMIKLMMVLMKRPRLRVTAPAALAAAREA